MTGRRRLASLSCRIVMIVVTSNNVVKEKMNYEENG